MASASLIPVVVADDEPAMLDIMARILAKSGGFHLAATARDGAALLDMWEAHRPRLVILDVEMPCKTGVECARIIQDTDPSCMLVFATAHEKYMADAFQVYAFDYLVKPFKVERAMKTLERVKELCALKDSRGDGEPLKPAVAGERIMIKLKDGMKFLDTPDILLIQREERSTALYTSDGGRYVTADSLAEMEARLNSTTFFRCHKSYIINLRQIDQIMPYGRWTYIVRMRGLKQDALITQDKFDELKGMYAMS